MKWKIIKCFRGCLMRRRRRRKVMFADLRKTPNKSLEKCAEANDNFHNSSKSSTAEHKAREAWKKWKTIRDSGVYLFPIFISNSSSEDTSAAPEIFIIPSDLSSPRWINGTVDDVPKKKRITEGEQTRIIINVEVFYLRIHFLRRIF